MKFKLLSVVALMGFAVSSYASTVSVPMYLMGKGQLQQSVGTVVLVDDASGNGLTVQPNLKGLTPVLAVGNHTVLLYGQSCVDALRSMLNSGAAVNLGSISNLMLSADGTMSSPTNIPGASVSRAMGQAVVIRGGDNGSGYHIVCGMVPATAKPMLGSSN